MATKIGKFVITCLLLLLSQMTWLKSSFSQDISTTQPLEFNTDYVAPIGEKIYTLKTDGATIKKVQGVISGIKKNRDNTIYMLVEFQERPLPGAPVFFDSKVIGMVYRQSTAGDLFEAMPVKVILDFMENLNLPVLNVKTSKGDNQGEPSEDKISTVKGYIEARDYDKAVKILQDALEKDADNAELRGWLGIAMIEMGNATQAAIEFKKAIAIEPNNADFHNGLGYAMLAAGSLDKAITSFKEAIRINPRHADAHYGIGRAYINLGEIKLATKEYMTLKDIDNKAADRLFQLIMRKDNHETE